MLGSAILRPSARTTHFSAKQRTRRYRYLHTPASFTSGSSRATFNARHGQSVDKKHGRPSISAENTCAKVKAWDLLRGPAEALALIRAVEQQYGPVESFTFYKEFDHPYLYQTHVKINFRDAESRLRVPESTDKIHIRAPEVQARRPGGVGLDEILPVLSESPEFLTADQVSEMSPNERSIDFRIERSANAFYISSPYRRAYFPRPIQTGFEMLKWGGFHDLKPIDSKRPITNEDLTQEKLDHVYMRASLRDWAQYLDERNPYELYPDEQTKDEGLKLESESSLNKKEEAVDDLMFAFDSSSGSAAAASKPDPAHDPFKDILDMEDFDLTGTKTEVVGVTKDATELSQSAPTPSTSQADQLQHEEEPSPTQPSVTRSTSQPSTPTSTSEVEVQERGQKQPNREVDESLVAQLSEAKKLRELAQSTGKPKEKQNVKAKPKNRAKRQKATPKPDTKKTTHKREPEPKSRLGGFFSKIQELFRGS